ncbi:class I SAM-dependent methyltransferase [Arthrobacter sp. Sa2CUA1]|uniref:Class I SAM-dependent methyltransferase n=1 Tax=Arthrobacter gallicola TaxID=2762225 RepID=A0ABR8UWK2_9MICC|nr:class I SAM-dependent methyltransferase [Arthrobacter gallicola]MBD7996923.1 class I SAM-dependent methyltransferase [Arthrobacter gallicola]
MSESIVEVAYSLRAAGYTTLFGSIEAAHPADRRFVAEWAATVDGPVIDAGCGPGHWTKYLTDQGLDVEGIDLVPAFISHARAQFPDIPFRVASVRDIGAADESLGGILAWYSLIHLEPDDVPGVLAEMVRCLRPGGSLLAGFFESAEIEQFPHQVAPAYSWPVQEFTRLLEDAGLTAAAVETRTDPGHRPHAAIIARRSV